MCYPSAPRCFDRTFPFARGYIDVKFAIFQRICTLGEAYLRIGAKFHVAPNEIRYAALAVESVRIID